MISGDTIAAISSAMGPAARMLVRLSGPRAHEIATSLAGQELGLEASARRMTLRFGELTVPAWVYAFHSPRSYTGEDLIELHLPGNPLLVRMLLDELLRRGARTAEAGEFTARAYFNGRMDLTEAEGVAAAVGARGEQELRAARQLLSGELARRLRPMMDQLANTLALVEVGIDFSEEDVTFISGQEISRRASEIGRALQQLVGESARFERLTHEPQLVLVGRPNAGKSTLLNALAGTQRAVVSPIAGTTRDVISAEVALQRGIIRLMDAAGLEEHPPAAADQSPQADIARQMHARALAAMESADAVVLVHDATDTQPMLVLPREPDVIVLTKSDLVAEESGAPLCSEPGMEVGRQFPTSHAPAARRPIAVSAKTGCNVAELRQRLDALAFGRISEGSTLALNSRHLQAIAEAQAALARADQVARKAGLELIALELREALDALGRIVGQVTPDDVLGRVFATFCIGK